MSIKFAGLAYISIQIVQNYRSYFYPLEVVIQLQVDKNNFYNSVTILIL